MTTENFIFIAVCIVGVLIWTAIVFVIAYKLSFHKGYNTGVEIGVERTKRQNKFSNYDISRRGFWENHYDERSN